ncbi:ribonuclease HI family protein [Massilia sp. TSP1-1-2]|uniref:ribonuclease HI family protein n=1 Tax=unclassified Massilia TaxID=2609279 RepID=UPI003CF7D627
MTDFSDLCAIAFHGERVAARRLAARSGVTEAAALRITLEQAAGLAGLAGLVAGRNALQTAAHARTVARREEKERANQTRAARHDGAATPWRGWFDGSAHPNPGRCGIGALLLGPGGEKFVVSRAAGYGNSSEAEYLALIALLDAALAAGARALTIYGDSQVVIDDVARSDGGQSPALARLREQARTLIARLGAPALRWIPRHKNGEADALSQRAIAAWTEPSTAGPAS